jgi:hypothetical protein
VHEPEVIGVGAQGLVAAGGLRQPRAQDRRAQAVLERLVGAEVGRERQRREDLAGRDRSVDA